MLDVVVLALASAFSRRNRLRHACERLEGAAP